MELLLFCIYFFLSTIKFIRVGTILRVVSCTNRERIGSLSVALNAYKKVVEIFLQRTVLPVAYYNCSFDVQ